MAHHPFARRAAGVAVATGTVAATIAVAAEPAAADHTAYCGTGINTGTHAGRSYRVVYQHDHVDGGKLTRHYFEQELRPSGWVTISSYHKQCS